MRPTLTLLTALLVAPLAARVAAEAPPDLALFDGNCPRARDCTVAAFCVD